MLNNLNKNPCSLFGELSPNRMHEIIKMCFLTLEQLQQTCFSKRSPRNFANNFRNDSFRGVYYFYTTLYDTLIFENDIRLSSVVDPDPDPYWECGSGSRGMEIDMNSEYSDF